MESIYIATNLILLILQISKDLHHLFPKVGTATYDMGHKDGVVFRFDPITSFPGQIGCGLIIINDL